MKSVILSPEDRTGEERASFLSRLTFGFVTSLLVLGAQQPLQAADLPRIHRRFLARNVSARWELLWSRERQRARPSLVRALIRCYVYRFQFSVALELIELTFNFFSPILMQAMITYTSTLHRSRSEGFFYVSVTFASSIFRALSATQTGLVLAGLGMDCQTALTSTIYTRTVLAPVSGPRYSRGELQNLQSNDCLKVSNTITAANSFWATPANLIIAVVLLVRTIGRAAFAGMFVLVASMPANSLAYWALASLRLELLQLTDRRLTSMSEVLQGIRVVKFTSLEEHSRLRVASVRRQELTLLKRQAYWHAMASVVLFVVPILTSTTTFVAHTYMGFILTPATVFGSTALFGALRAPLGYLPILVSSLAEAKSSVRRLEKYLLLPQLHREVLPAAGLEGDAVVAANASFRWEEDGPEVLKNLSFRVRRGELCAIIGKIGCGKTSLLCAMLGEMEKTQGHLFVSGRLGYAQQQAWTTNATAQANICFSSAYSATAYERALRVCALERDFALLPAGDKTEIGEQGVNLSGGQRQRLSLARVCYAAPEVAFLDDPLSAVDPRVGKHLFEQCIVGCLGGKTRFLATHQLQLLAACDMVLLLDDGQIAFCGSYPELVNSPLNISDFMLDPAAAGAPTAAATAEAEAAEEEARADGAAAAASADDLQLQDNQDQWSEEDGRLVQEEERAIGAVDVATVAWYLRNCGEVLLFFVVFLALSEITRTSTDLHLSYWSDQKFWPDAGTGTYLAIYVWLGWTSSLQALLKGLALVEASFIASNRLHQRMLSGVLRAQIVWHDAQPAGRILNRFSRDLDALDAGIADQLAGLVGLASLAVGTILVIGAVQPVVLLAAVPLSSVYWSLQELYRASSRELNRVVATAASPIYSHFGETLSGLITLRVFNLTEQVISENHANLDNFHGPYWAALNVGRWLSLRLEAIGSTILFAASLLVVTQSSLPPGLVGLTLSYSTQITMVLELTVTAASGLESELNSVERAQAYTRDIPLEAPLVLARNRPSFRWLADSAAVRVEHLYLRYRPRLPYALADLSFSLASKEKLGIVGRTGSGKSSLMLSLVRLVEPAGGRVVLDGVDTREVGLTDLRSRVAAIPQDPVLFAGSLRSNLDPDAQHSDRAIWRALDLAHLRSSVSQTDEQLEVAVVEGGSNFSVGQRQLVCLARALLRNSRLLLLDEVTASVDLETDAMLQRCIAVAFSDCTVLTIAHRLETILTAGRCLVLADGRGLEFDSPAALLQRPNSVFRSMVAETGERAGVLEQMAAGGALVPPA